MWDLPEQGLANGGRYKAVSSSPGRGRPNRILNVTKEVITIDATVIKL